MALEPHVVRTHYTSIITEDVIAVATRTLEWDRLSKPFVKYVMTAVDNFSAWYWIVDFILPERTCKAKIFGLHFLGEDGASVILFYVHRPTTNRTSFDGSVRSPCIFTHNEFACL